MQKAFFGLLETEMVVRVPGHALHEKGLQGQKGVGPLVSSWERRAAVVPLMNRLSTARCVPPFPDMPCMKKVYRDK